MALPSLVHKNPNGWYRVALQRGDIRIFENFGPTKYKTTSDALAAATKYAKKLQVKYLIPEKKGAAIGLNVGEINRDYILNKLKKGYVVKDIAQEWGRKNNINMDRSRGSYNPEASKIYKKINNQIFGYSQPAPYSSIPADNELLKILETNKANRAPEVVQRQFNEFIKNNHKKYVNKPGGTEKLYADAVKWFEKNNPGPVLRYEGITTDMRPDQKVIRGLVSGEGATLASFRKGKKEIKQLVSPASRTRKPEIYQTRKVSWEKAAESLGMTRGQYQGMLQKNMIEPLKRLFPQLIGTKYVPGVEHMYGLRQAIATGLMKEIKKAAKNVAPSPSSFNYGVKGTQLDRIITGQVENAFNTRDMAQRREYIKTANQKIAEFKSEYPGKYPKYVVDKVGNIKDVNMGNINLAKQSLNKQATQFVDYLIKTPGFKESKEFASLPETSQTLIQSRIDKSPRFYNQLVKSINSVPALKSMMEKRVRCAEGCLAQVAKNEPGKFGKALETLPQKAKGFLGLLGRGGMKAAPLAAVAAAGAIAEPLVKQFRNDDPSTYLSNPDQQKGMLLSMLESETPQVDEEILKWQYPGQIAGAAAAIPGSSAVMKARKARKFGTARAALGPAGKVLAGSFSPLAVAASLPIGIAAQVKGGSDFEDIATDPFNWIGPAFASSGARIATRGMNPTGILAKAIRMGMSPGALRVVSRLGAPGLALTAGLKGYDLYKNWGQE